MVYVAVLLTATALAGLARSRSDREGRSKQAGNLPLVLCVAILAGLAGFRWGVGADFYQYVANYLGVYREQFTWSTRDPGFRLLTRVAVAIYDHPSTFFMLASLLTVGLTVIALRRNSPNFAFAIFLYVTTISWQGSFNAVRQYLAAAVVLAGLQLILKQRFWPYAIVVACASLFHLSAIVLLLLYFVPLRRLKIREVVLLGAAAIVALNSYDIVVRLLVTLGIGDVSSADYFQESIHPLRVAIALGPYMLYLFTSRHSVHREVHFFGSMMLLNALVWVFALDSAYLARFAIYTNILVALSIPWSLREVSEPRVRLLAGWVIGLVYFVYWYLGTADDPFLNPYRSIFDTL